MKTIRYILYLTFLFSVTTVSTAQKIALTVGNPAPPLSVYQWIKGSPTTTWQPGKIYVVEFGATWCTPCAAAIPELSAMALKYQGEVEVISLYVMEMNTEAHNKTVPAYVRKVEASVHRHGDLIRYTVGVDDPERQLEKSWLKAAGLDGIPQFFVIDRQGMIAWIGGSAKQADERVAWVRSKVYSLQASIHQYETAQQAKSTYDPTKLLLIDDNGGKQTDFLFRSVLTRYDGKFDGESTIFIQSAYWLKPDSLYDRYEDKVTVINGSLGHLYYIAYADTLSNQVPVRNWWNVYPDTLTEPFKNNSYGKYWQEPLLEGVDKTPFTSSYKSTLNRYNYSLKVPTGMGTSKFLQEAMRNDLNTYFGYDASVETRLMPYWKLYAPDKGVAVQSLKSKDPLKKFQKSDQQGHYIFKNASMRDVIWMLGMHFGYGSLDYGKLPREQQAAFVDETGITEDIDFTFDPTFTFDQAIAYLHTCGLELVRSVRPIKVIIIRNGMQARK